MTEQQHFQAPPLPPHAPAFGVQPQAQIQPQTEAKEEIKDGSVVGNTLPEDDFATALKLPISIYKKKVMIMLLVATAFVGVILGAVMFGGSSAPQAAPSGLMGVVRNPDIRENLGRCGTVGETSPCVLYIVNHSRNDKLAENFFEEAVKLTGRQDFLIRIENKLYTKQRIPPGYIAQIKVPGLR